MDNGKEFEKLAYASLENNNLQEAESNFLKALNLM